MVRNEEFKKCHPDRHAGFRKKHRWCCAKVLGYRFIDSDLEIQSQEGKRLPELIEEFGTEGFLDIEARVNASIEAERCVIATGGSVVYRDSAMQHLKEIGTVVYLKLTCEELEKLSNSQGWIDVCKPKEPVNAG